LKRQYSIERTDRILNEWDIVERSIDPDLSHRLRFSMHNIRPSFGRYLIGAALIAAVLLALFDPSPSQGLRLLPRLLFWLLHSVIGVGLFAGVNRVLVAWRVRRLGPWAVTLLAGLIGSALFAPAALIIESALGVPEDLESPAETWLLQLGWLGSLAEEYFQVVLPATGLWLALNTPWLLQLDFSRSGKGAVGAENPTTESSAAALDEPATTPKERAEASVGERLPPEPPIEQRLDLLLGKLPSAMGTDIVALSSELQYLRVYTTQGKALILHSLQGAIELLSTIDGYRVHRSHWIATSHVRHVVRDGRTMRLKMSNDLEIPVSRPHQREVREVFGDQAKYSRTSDIRDGR